MEVCSPSMQRGGFLLVDGKIILFRIVRRQEVKIPALNHFMVPRPLLRCTKAAEVS